MLCKECKYWVFAYKKLVGEDEYFVGECRIRSTAGNSFPERFDYENCFEFVSKRDEVENNVPSLDGTSKKALEFIETNKRPAARARSSEWDEYIDTIKKILQGVQ